MATESHILEGQGRHVLLLTVLLVLAALLARWADLESGAAWGLPAAAWYWLAIGIAIGHQVFVAVCWRLELHRSALSRRFGAAGFRLYAAGFAILGCARFVPIIALAWADRDTLPIDRRVRYVIAIALTVPAAYAMYSVARYFTMTRAVGADHFDPRYRDMPLERRGIFRFVPNAMYTVAFLLIWLPGVLAASKGALLAALFSHAYIWVHYFCTERPDMRRIYDATLVTDRRRP